jgi:hypothetical protein
MKLEQVLNRVRGIAFMSIPAAQAESVGESEKQKFEAFAQAVDARRPVLQKELKEGSLRWGATTEVSLVDRVLIAEEKLILLITTPGLLLQASSGVSRNIKYEVTLDQYGMSSSYSGGIDSIYLNVFFSSHDGFEVDQISSFLLHNVDTRLVREHEKKEPDLGLDDKIYQAFDGLLSKVKEVRRLSSRKNPVHSFSRPKGINLQGAIMPVSFLIDNLIDNNDQGIYIDFGGYYQWQPSIRVGDY